MDRIEPAARMKEPGGERSRDRVRDDRELRELWNALEQLAQPINEDALRETVFVEPLANSPLVGAPDNGVDGLVLTTAARARGMAEWNGGSDRDAARTRDHRERALHRKIAADTTEKLHAMLQGVGLRMRPTATEKPMAGE